MRLKVYRIYCEPNNCEHCSVIAFSKEQAEEYCRKSNKEEKERSYIHKDRWFYTDEEEIDTSEVFECW